ncbi:LytTR family DNA-binding domain-containing protein [uncultured Tenacibaculum sp.]|uniref:LytR/AlgR family response regulator transcription factor n=1 Tax=uncultured Tenacibaculum sp. TaxID=174713 RepID=UPI00262466AA|nr:LytTR family DNA-binding domain-containing protein [uncultured Tenacibaculum sp.]
MNIKCVIVNDNKNDKKRIEFLLNQNNHIDLYGSFTNNLEAIDNINKMKPDVVFLDITGFEIIEKITLAQKPLFIFINNNDKFAQKAFDYCVFDHILSPYKDTRFQQTIDKIVNHFRKEELLNLQSNLNDILSIVKNTANIENRKINIKSGNKIFFIDISTIKYISASGYYVEIYTTDDKKHLLRESLLSIMRRLNSNKFIRIHRSTIINKDYIEEIIASNYGEIDVKISSIKKLLRVSKGYKKEFQEEMGVK